MADNVTSGGVVVATDDVGGVQYQIVKLDLGPDGQTSQVSGAIPVTVPTLTTANNGGIDLASGSSTQILGANLNRRKLIITNDGGDVVYLALGAAAAAYSGIRVNPSGGSFSIDGWTGSVSGTHVATGLTHIAFLELS